MNPMAERFICAAGSRCSGGAAGFWAKLVAASTHEHSDVIRKRKRLTDEFGVDMLLGAVRAAR